MGWRAQEQVEGMRAVMSEEHLGDQKGGSWTTWMKSCHLKSWNDLHAKMQDPSLIDQGGKMIDPANLVSQQI